MSIDQQSALRPGHAGGRHARTPRTVAVVGGGASGLLTAVALLRADRGARVVLHEPATPGHGIAYRTTDQRHLLNVRTRDMSALADEPAHFADWARRSGYGEDPFDFLPRAVYARYLTDLRRSHDDGRLTVRRTGVVDVVPTGGAGGHAVLDERGATAADAVVLAYGNLPPARLAVDGRELPAAPWHLPHAWDVEALRALPARGRVVLVGSGLTAVDAAITLLADAGPDGGREVVMVSRNGLLPGAHLPQPCSTAWATVVPDDVTTADALTAHVRGQVRRAEAAGVCWRSVIDGLRGSTQRLWQRLDLAERQRFVQHHARHWDVVRHRMAPRVAATLEEFTAAGRLRLVGGGLADVVDLGATARVTLAAENGAAGELLEADAVVNCTGPSSDLDRTAHPLAATLRERGLLARDPLGLGVACTPDGRVLGADGEVRPGLFVVGPPRKGTLWETTAVPEIRTQAAALAALVAAPGAA